ncbi:hypothetical protein SAMN05519103_04605 [Rhizobiales bacterium GAS113]|jgi:hypothetical protein|nr:hypothetical protein SAMN05519103_04605 [Rhizobiales bacterium GAS113]
MTEKRDQPSFPGQLAKETSAREIQGDAVFSQFGRWTLRHRLDRWWGDGPRALICMMNPSRAGTSNDDPTIHRLLRLTDRPHLSGFTVVNFEPYVAADPADLRKWRDAITRKQPSGYASICSANLALIRGLAETAAIRIIAWGKLALPVPHRTKILQAMSIDATHDLCAFGVTQDGSPKHPMARGRHRIPDAAEPVLWMPAIPPRLRNDVPAQPSLAVNASRSH